MKLKLKAVALAVFVPATAWAERIVESMKDNLKSDAVDIIGIMSVIALVIGVALLFYSWILIFKRRDRDPNAIVRGVSMFALGIVLAGGGWIVGMKVASQYFGTDTSNIEQTIKDNYKID